MDTITKYQKAVEEYMTRLQFQNLSPKTLRNYETTLRLFGDFLAENPTDDLYEAVECWKESMLRKGNAASTTNTRLTQLSIFFTKACKRSFPKELRFSDNPVEEVELTKVVKRPYGEVIPDNLVPLLFVNEPPKNAKKSLWARNFAMIQLLLNEKIRLDELLSLTPADVDVYHHELTIQNGKGRKFRVVDLTDMSIAALEAYSASGIRPLVSDTAPLFGTTAAKIKGVSARGCEWHKGSEMWAEKIVEAHIRNVTGIPKVHPHSLRHLGSRICLCAGQSMEELQGALGHSSITTTAIYTDRVKQRAHRDSAKAVLAARDAAAQKLQAELQLSIFPTAETA